MAGKPPVRGRLNGSQQSAMLAIQFPSFRQVQRGNPFVWIGKLQPTQLSETYTVRITYEHGTIRPRVEVLDPPLQKRGNTRIPHTFPDGSICLHLSGEWNSTQFIHQSIIPWTSTWLYYYEVWLITGEWLGGGHERNPPQESR